MATVFKDREEAGRLLASCLTDYASRADWAVVAGISDGGVIIASELARSLHLPLVPPASRADQFCKKLVILVDESIASADAMQQQIAAARQLGAVRVIAATPLLERALMPHLWQAANDLAFLLAPEQVGDIRSWFERFPVVTESDVKAALNGERPKRPQRAGMTGNLVQLS